MRRIAICLKKDSLALNFFFLFFFFPIYLNLVLSNEAKTSRTPSEYVLSAVGMLQLN